MRLGLNLGYWGADDGADNLVLAQEADTMMVEIFEASGVAA